MSIQLTEPKVLFENRYDAGAKLASELSQYAGQSAVVLAIPNGGVAVAIEVAGALKADLEVIISRKIPIPLNLEGGLGAIAEDGTIIINEDVVRRDGITPEQIEYEASKVKASIKERGKKYTGDRLPARLTGRVVIIVDDGLASGITMMAAAESVRRRRPKQLVVAVPIAHDTAVNRVRPVSDRVVACAVASLPKFYLADYYHHLHEVSDEEVVRLLQHWYRMQN